MQFFLACLISLLLVTPSLAATISSTPLISGNLVDADKFPISRAGSGVAYTGDVSKLKNTIRPNEVVVGVDAHALTLVAANTDSDNVGKTIILNSPVTMAANLNLATDRAWRFEKGAVITTTGYTFNANGAPIEIGNYQVFAGTGTVTGLKESRPEWFGQNTTPGTTDMGTEIQAAINAAPKIIFDRTTYAKSTAITVPANRELIGYGATITTTADNTNGFTVTGSNVAFRGLTITGPQYATQSTSRGISAVGASSSAYLENLNVIDCNISSWGIYGVYMQFVDGFDFSGTTIENIFYGGIMGLSVKNGSIPASTHIKNVTGNISGSAYGISLTRDDNDSLTTHPRSDNIVVSARVSNVPAWNGIGTHGGSNITVANAIVTGCKIGIEAVAAGNTAHDSTFAPINFNVVNPTVSSGVTGGTAGPGIRIAGAGTGVGTYSELATGSINGGIITGHGDESNNADGGIYLLYSKNVAVSGVSIYEPGTAGISVYHDNYGVSITGCSIVDAWTNAGALAYGINMASDYNTGVVSGNSFTTDTKSATHVMDYSVRTGTGINNSISLGNNYSESTSYAIDGSSGDVALTGTFTASTTWNPPSVLNGATTTKSVTVTNATVGSNVIAAFSVALPTNVYLRSECTSTAAVTVTLVNVSGSTQDIAEGTLKVVVFK